MTNPEKKALVFDIDETLFNSVQKHYDTYRAYAEAHEAVIVPSLDEVILLGGTHAYFGQFEWYLEMNARMRSDEAFNRGQEQIEGALEAATQLQHMIVVYLTTRPDSLAKITHQELLDAGFPDRPVICRPEDIKFTNTSEWKLTILAQLAKEHEATMVMIDDSIHLHQTLTEASKNGHQKIVDTILFDGPMTLKGNGEMNWAEITQMMLGLANDA